MSPRDWTPTAIRTSLRSFGRRSREALLLAAVTGFVVGLAIAGFEWLAGQQLLERLYRLPVGVQLAAPLAGLILAASALRWLASGATPSTSDEYIANFHAADRRLDPAPFLGRVMASITTLGLGGALGFEGPSIYIGATIGTAMQTRFRRLFATTDTKVLMVAGAAAGVAAIFKTPATGAIFAIEVPFQDDTAKRMLLPALIASATSYLVYVAINGTTPLFPIDGTPPFGIKELAGAALIGLIAGTGARAFAAALKGAKHLSASAAPVVRVAVAGITLAGLLGLSRAVYGESLTLGSGYNVIEWVADGRHALWMVALLFVLRAVATTATVAGGGAGGLFIPLVVLGALLGRMTGDVFAEPTATLFPVIGIAAFLGAGYRTPLAAVVFVAESTGRPGFIVPGLIATVVSQLPMGRSSVSAFQRSERGGHLERRFTLPITSAIQGDVLTAPPDISLDDLMAHHLLMTRQTTVAVVDGQTYVGLVHLADLSTVARDRWRDTTVGSVAHDDAPRAGPSWLIADAVRAMEQADLDLLPVVDDEGRFAGVVTTADLVRLDEILRSSEGDL